MIDGYLVAYELKNPLNESKLLGPNNTILCFIEELLGCTIFVNHALVKIKTDNQNQLQFIRKLFDILEELVEANVNITSRDIVSIVQSIEVNKEEELKKLYFEKDIILMLSSGKPIYPKTINQKLFLQALQQNEICFAVGPAGTGKTFLAVLYAVSLLKKNIVKKIVLVRPVVEAGERLGFLPGDLKEKIDPYLIPLYDALNDALGKEVVVKLIDKGSIEVAPLAYMRGRTLDNAIIILDEAQNATTMQMKMFLTRLGFQSKMIITGDITQIDLPNKNQSGLVQAIELLRNINGIAIAEFNKYDVMRHPLVYKIVKKYEEK
ncbi:MAG: PhoH family protein [Bacilli bacterium]|jgi:phosphate starvation-inducible PhoH-like protein|nr:PhoH family protein [Bacilli bacterium]